MMGACTSGIACWLYARLMRRLPPLAALSSTFMITGFGVLGAVWFLGEKVDNGLYLAGALLLLSCLLEMGFDPPQRIRAMLAARR